MPPFTPPAADAVRARLLAAGRDEFAAVGLAGAKVERIGAAAGSNKAQVFHYFGSKDGLFDAVLADAVSELFAQVPVDPDDLPAWAGRVHDAFADRPATQRLLAWHRLEAPGAASLEAVVRSYGGAVADVERAQRAGTLARTYRPAVLLALVLHLAAFWGATGPELDSLLGAMTPARRRQVVVDAVTALVG